MPDRFRVIEAANLPPETSPARRLGDKGGLWIVFDATLGGPPSTSHLSTTNRPMADVACRALNAYFGPVGEDEGSDEDVFRTFGVALGKTGYFKPEGT